MFTRCAVLCCALRWRLWRPACIHCLARQTQTDVHFVQTCPSYDARHIKVCWRLPVVLRTLYTYLMPPVCAAASWVRSTFCHVSPWQASSIITEWLRHSSRKAFCRKDLLPLWLLSWSFWPPLGGLLVQSLTKKGFILFALLVRYMHATAAAVCDGSASAALPCSGSGSALLCSIDAWTSEAYRFTFPVCPTYMYLASWFVSQFDFFKRQALAPPFLHHLLSPRSYSRLRQTEAHPAFTSSMAPFFL